MKAARICTLTCALLALVIALLPAAAAAQEPEAAYGNFHRAVVAGDVNEMMRYMPGAQRPELAGLSAAQKDAHLKMMAALMPRAFLLKNKNLDPNGRGARLLVSGPGQVLVGNKPEALYGTIRMVMEGDGWKVADVNWSNTPPEGMQAEPQAAPAPKNVQTPAVPRTAAPVVGSMDAAPARKLGTQKPPCVYKPVMTAEDLENCK